MSTGKVARDVAQSSSMRHNPAPRTTEEEWEEYKNLNGSKEIQK